MEPSSNDGILLHVTGDLHHGMKFEEKSVKNPRESTLYSSQSPLGWVATGDLDRMRSICQSNPPPKKQYSFGKPLYPGEPLNRCQEWTKETVNMLTSQGVLQRSSAATAEDPSSAATAEDQICDKVYQK